MKDKHFKLAVLWGLLSIIEIIGFVYTEEFYVFIGFCLSICNFGYDFIKVILAK